MTQDIRHSSPKAAARAGFGKGAALFPLALVATAVAILAVGAGRMSEPPEKAQARMALASAHKAASLQEVAQDNARAEEAAAAAMMALALARVAPTVDEASLAEAERAGQARQSEPEAEAQKARDRKIVRREMAPTAAKPAMTPPPVAEPAPVFFAAPLKPAKPDEKPGVLRRVGEYMPSLPSPGRIVDAMGDGVSKIADLMPKF